MDDTDYALGRTRAEYQRLIEQADILRPITERMLIAAGVKPGLRVLDVGCGVGDVSFLVASLVGPEGSVTGSIWTRMPSSSPTSGAQRKESSTSSSVSPTRGQRIRGGFSMPP